MSERHSSTEHKYYGITVKPGVRPFNTFTEYEISPHKALH